VELLGLCRLINQVEGEGEEEDEGGLVPGVEAVVMDMERERTTL